MDYCYENLLNAVILQAVEDWRRSGKDNRSVIERQLRKNPLLSSYNLDYIFEKLKEEDDERRTIKEGLPPTSPCLNYHIGLCKAPCAG